MPIELVNRQRLAKIDGERFTSLAAAVLAAIGCEHRELTIALVRDARIRELNALYRGTNAATDVLSFPSDPGSEHLGDIVISVDIAVGQAERERHSLERELSELVIHGVLHLAGYDHETDRGEMSRLELALRRRLLTDSRPRRARRAHKSPNVD